MNIGAEQLEQLQAVLVSDGDAVSFFKAGTASKAGYWYVGCGGSINESGPQDEGGDPDYYEERDTKTFLEFAKGNDLTAEVPVYYGSTYSGKDEVFSDWNHLARYLGISDLVAISTKVPKAIASKFTYYATKQDNISATLRQLVYDFVVESIKENAKRDAFR